MKREPKSLRLSLAVLLVSAVVHTLLAVIFCAGAVVLMIHAVRPEATGWLTPFFLAALPLLWCGYTRVSGVANAEVARSMIWLVYGEWVPR
ncbi:hypothetical protein ELH92_25860 [Rhizobium ruizarguesonis]|uniref:hypothetical protein n=1 Tax=Rhizobium ruizarguesonis TaxID=2081791 RepID=UPI0010318E72|nr:hypothetical protein [Rhizobium ruizarguesonis]TAY24452.1 hypothetical protein ELH92_25860 [Rhizobium ruizarguesonis]